MRLSLCVFTVLLLLTIALNARAELQWTIVAADTAGDVGRFCSLALDAEGNPHIAYRENSTRRLMHAARTGSGWTTEIADPRAEAGGVGTTTSVAVSSGQTVGIAYGDAPSDLLHYAELAGSWTNRSIAIPTPGGNASLAFDVNSEPHVAYRDPDAPPRLMETYKASGSWLYQIIDGSGAGPGQWPSMRCGSDGQLRVAYQYSALNEVRFAARDSVVWAPTTVDTASFVGLYTSLAVDSVGQPHVAYANTSTKDLWYATRVSGLWQREIADSSGITGYYPSVATTSDGQPWIAYCRYISNDTAFVQVATRINGAWIKSVIDTVRTLERVGLGLDSFGRAHVTYYDGWSDDLMYAVSDAPTGVTPGRPTDTRLKLWPNPSLGGRVFMALTGTVIEREVRVYDLSGRHVRSLLCPMGANPMEWDGRDAAGRPVAAGTYLFRLGGGGEPQRLTLIR